MLARFERLMERAVEGGLRRVFPTNLQPVQLAKAAARAMEGTRLVGVSGPEVPNLYVLRLAPADLERFASYRATLTRELGGYLLRYAADRRLQPVAEPRVELVPDEAVPIGSVEVDARFVDIEPVRRAALEQALEGTRRLRLRDVPTPGPAPAGGPTRAWLTDPTGLRFPLEPSSAPVRIGRAADNDLALASQRVSRYHAQLRWEQGRWLVYDLHSTNGTFLDGERVLASPRPLRPGARLRLGDHELELQTDGGG